MKPQATRVRKFREFNDNADDYGTNTTVGRKNTDGPSQFVRIREDVTE